MLDLNSLWLVHYIYIDMYIYMYMNIYVYIYLSNIHTYMLHTTYIKCYIYAHMHTYKEAFVSVYFSLPPHTHTHLHPGLAFLLPVCLPTIGSILSRQSGIKPRRGTQGVSHVLVQIFSQLAHGQLAHLFIQGSHGMHLCRHNDSLLFRPSL